MSEFHVPQVLKLPSHLPTGITATRKTVFYPAKENSVGPGFNCTIYPQTGVVGVVVDSKTACLVMDVNIENTNPLIDYLNMGVEGLGHKIIDRLAWYNQGQPLEEINHYGVIASAMANLSGAYQQQVSYYVSSKLRDGHTGSMHRNFIKPPMMDRNGSIMWGCNPTGIGYISNGVGSSQYATTGTAISASALAEPIMASRYKANQSGVYFLTAAVATSCVTALGDFPFVNTAQAGALSPWVGNATTTQTWTGMPNFFTPMDWPEALTPSMLTKAEDIYQSEYGSINKNEIANNLVNVKCYPIGVKPTKNAYLNDVYGTLPATSYALDNTATGTGATVVAGVAVNPCAAMTIGTGTATVTVIRIVFRPHSGILGTMAKKVFPSMLCSSGQFYLEFRTALPEIVFQVSSDPCRRIPGTIRDYIRNIGTRNGHMNYGAEIFTANAITNGASTQEWATSSYAPGYGPWSHIPLTIGTTKTTSYANSIFGPASAEGRNEMVVYSSETDFITTLTLASTTTIAAGGLGAGVPTNITFPVGTIIDTTAAVTGTATVTAVLAEIISLTGIGASAVYTVNTAIGSGAGTLTNVAIRMAGLASANIPPTPQYVLTATPWKYKGGNKLSAGTESVPLSIVYCPENRVFYGTRLPSSVPQTARIFSLTYDGTNFNGGQGASFAPNLSGQYGTLNYYLTNVGLRVDEITLQADMTQNFIETAAAGRMQIHVQTVMSSLLQLQNSETQSINIPTVVHAAKRLIVCFQNMQVRGTGTGYVYDSNCGSNPFVAVYPRGGTQTAGLAQNANGWAANSNTLVAPTSKTILYGNGYDSPLVVAGFPMATSNTGKKLQLKIGSEYYPPAPITTMAEMILEFTKAIDGFASDSGASFNVDSDIVAYGKNGSVASTIAGFVAPSLVSSESYCENKAIYNPFQGNRFTTPFIPQHCMDDQTFTGNPDMAPLYSRGGALSNDGIALNSSTTYSTSLIDSSYNGFNYLCPQGHCIQNMFTPQSSSYLAVVDLSPWGKEDGCESYTFLPGQNVILEMGGASALGAPDIFGQYRAIAIVPCRGTWSLSTNGIQDFAL